MAPEIIHLALWIIKHTQICTQICKIPFRIIGLIWTFKYIVPVSPQSNTYFCCTVKPCKSLFLRRNKSN